MACYYFIKFFVQEARMSTKSFSDAANIYCLLALISFIAAVLAFIPPIFVGLYWLFYKSFDSISVFLAIVSSIIAILLLRLSGKFNKKFMNEVGN